MDTQLAATLNRRVFGFTTRSYRRFCFTCEHYFTTHIKGSRMCGGCVVKVAATNPVTQ